MVEVPVSDLTLYGAIKWHIKMVLSRRVAMQIYTQLVCWHVGNFLIAIIYTIHMPPHKSYN